MEACAGVAVVAVEPFRAEAPKRLIVQHVARYVDGGYLDAGLWISAFDSSGLAHLRRHMRVPLPALQRRVATPCALDLPTTGCYLSLPHFFPIADVAGRPDGDSAVYAQSVPVGGGGGGDAARQHSVRRERAGDADFYCADGAGGG